MSSEVWAECISFVFSEDVLHSIYVMDPCLPFQFQMGAADHIFTFLIDFKFYGIVIKSLGYEILRNGH